jgi:hypothetical protein
MQVLADSRMLRTSHPVTPNTVDKKQSATYSAAMGSLSQHHRSPLPKPSYATK